MKYPENETQELELLRRELEITAELNAKINPDMDFKNLLDEIIFTIRSLVDIDGCNIALINENGYMHIHRIEHSRLSDKTTLTEEYLEKVYSQSYDLNTSSAWACVVARERREIHFPIINYSDFLPDEQELLKNYNITSLYYLPLIVGDEILGTMRFHNYGGEMHLSDFEKDLIRRRTAIVSKAIHNARLYGDLKRKNEIIEIDMDLARRIQQNLLPQDPPEISGVSIAFLYQPMTAVGGDYYGFIIPSGRDPYELGCIITDASGHGVPAAFITSMIKLSMERDTIVSKFHEPAALMRQLNAYLLNNLADNFVTACYCYFNLKTMECRIANAGHVPLCRINRTAGEIMNYNPAGPVLGYFDDACFKEEIIRISSSDRFLLYTDGLAEACDRNGNFYIHKLEAFLKESVSLETGEFLDKLYRDIKNHSLFGSRESLEDDLAFVVIDIP